MHKDAVISKFLSNRPAHAMKLQAVGVR